MHAQGLQPLLNIEVPAPLATPTVFHQKPQSLITFNNTFASQSQPETAITMSTAQHQLTQPAIAAKPKKKRRRTDGGGKKEARKKKCAGELQM